MALLASIFSRLLDLIFPPVCVNCRTNVESGQAICEQCFSKIKIFNSLFCGRCLARLPQNKKICHFDFPYILGSAADYRDEAVKNLVQGLKFNFLKSAARPLGALLINYARNIPLAVSGYVVLPVPLSRLRHRQRGFNQSLLLAEIFSRHFNLEMKPEILVRTRNTKPQSEIKNYDQKKENARNCFSIKEPELVTGRNFILIDDVSTSGATFFEAATCLKQAGARKIICLAAAKG